MISHKIATVLCVLFSFIVFSAKSDVIKIDDTLYRNTQFKFLHKFVFAPDSGHVHVSVDYDIPRNYSHQQNYARILFFHDATDDFASVISSGNSCEYKLKASAFSLSFDQLHAMSLNLNYTWEKQIAISGVRDRYWYAAVVNCQEEDIYLDGLTIRFTNPAGDFTHQFSMDQWGIWEMAIIDFCSTSFLLMFLGYFFYQSKTHDLLASTGAGSIYFVLFATIFFEWVATTLIMAYSDAHSQDGMGNFKLQKGGLFFDLFSQTAFSIFLLCFCKGMYLNYEGHILSHDDKRDIWEFGLVYAALSIALFAQSFEETLPNEITYLYETEAGLIMVAMRLWMLYVCLKNLIYRHKVPHLHRLVGVNAAFIALTGIFFLSLPLLLVISQAVPDHHIAKVMFVVDAMVVNLVYIMTLIILRPGGRLLQTFMYKTKTLEAPLNTVHIHKNETAESTSVKEEDIEIEMDAKKFQKFNDDNVELSSNDAADAF